MSEIKAHRMEIGLDWGGSQVVAASTEGFELYTYDAQPNSVGGVKVGARKAGTTGVGANAQDFDVVKGGETVTVPGSEFSASELTKYHVFYRSTAGGVEGTQTKSSSLDWDRLRLGAAVSTLDSTTGDDSVSTSTDTDLR